jgi:hypothetical protein
MSRPLTPAPERTDGRVYDAAYRRKRNRYVRKMGGRCEECGSLRKVECHHIDPRGPDADGNFKLLCSVCHHEAEVARTVSVNVAKLTEDEALAQVRLAYKTNPQARR